MYEVKASERESGLRVGGDVDGLVGGDGRGARAVIVHEVELLDSGACARESNLGVGHPRFSGNEQHHLVGHPMGGPARLGGVGDHFLRPDDPEILRGEIVEAHLDLEPVIPHREESLQGLHRSRRGEFREPGPHHLGAPRGQRRRARHHAEQRGEVQVHRGDAGQPVGPVLRVGAPHEREIGDGDVDLLHLPGPHIELDVGALRAGREGAKEGEPPQDQVRRAAPAAMDRPRL
jgi:hypothetical protein